MDVTLLTIAYVMAQRGTCSRAQVGCVIALDGRVLATGYNGAPRGMAHCDHPDGVPSSERPPDAEMCRDSVHAEANAVAFAARNGVGIDGSTVYTTLSPCVYCAQLLINAGTRRVVCGEVYRDPSGVELLLRAGVVLDVLSNSQPKPIHTYAIGEDEADDAE